MARFSPTATGSVALAQAALLLGGCDAPAGSSVKRHASDVANTTVPSRAAAASRTVQPKRTVLAFGDSLYAGYGLKRDESLPAAVEARLRDDGFDATVINAGVSGETTAGGRQRFVATLDQQRTRPDLVLLGLGANDALRLIDPAQTRANLVAMLDELRRRDIPAVMTGMMIPPQLAPAFARRYNAIWPELAREHGAVLDPFILAGVIGNRQLMLPDGVHPNAKGFARMADRLAPLVGARLRQLPPGPN